jgi:pimeloyl-ACP methyl ester carboxylesterase
VLIHGTWCGGWFYGPLAGLLRGQGNQVFTPTNTGLGERKHLRSRSITLETFMLDVVNLIEAEELRDVILVGHSSAGVPMSWVAERISDRVRHIVYLDANLALDGQTLFDAFPTDVAAARRNSVVEFNGVPVIPPPGAPPGSDATGNPVLAWFQRHATPHPLGAFDSPIRLSGPLGSGCPCTYVAFTKSPNPALDKSRALARAQSGWRWMELPHNHGAPIFQPDDVAHLLNGIS